MRLLSRLAGMAGLVLALAVTASTTASSAYRQAPARELPAKATSISIGDIALTPYGWADFCQR